MASAQAWPTCASAGKRPTDAAAGRRAPLSVHALSRVTANAAVAGRPLPAIDSGVYLGTLRLWLTIHAAGSLKDRRRTVKALVTRVRNNFNASAADLDDDPVPQRAVVGIACVSNDPRYLDAQLRRILEFVEALHLNVEVVDDQIEIARA